MNEKLQEAKKAYDLEVKDIKVPEAVATYVTLLEEECKRYYEYWSLKIQENLKLDDTIEELRGDNEHYRHELARALTRKY